MSEARQPSMSCATAEPLLVPGRGAITCANLWRRLMNGTDGELPPVVDLPTAAKMLGIGRTMAYGLVRTGEWPTPLIRVGRLIKVPTQPLMQLLSGAA